MSLKALSLLFIVVVANVVADNLQAHTLPVYKKSQPLQIKRQTGTHETVLVHGGVGTIGEFYANIQVGSPPQSFGVQLDTGSADLLIYATGCSGCNGSILFNYGSSSTFQYVACQNGPLYCPQCAQVSSSDNVCYYTDTYGDGSQVSGLVTTDKVAVGPIKTTVTLGLILESTSQFQGSGSQGIWGLGFQAVSAWNGVPAFQRMVYGNPINNAFSMCLLESGGTFTLGGSYTNDNRFQWTPYDSSNGQYAIGLTDVSVNGLSLGVASTVYTQQGCIVDSGSTQLLLPDAAYVSLKNLLSSLCGSTNLVGICGQTSSKNIWLSYCYQMADTDVNAYPNLTLTVNGISGGLVVTPQQYLFAVSGGYYCMGINSTAGVGVSTILGDTVMRRFNVVFDRVNKRVGFGDTSTCPSGATSTTASNGYDHTYTLADGTTGDPNSGASTLQVFSVAVFVALFASLM